MSLLEDIQRLHHSNTGAEHSSIAMSKATAFKLVAEISKSSPWNEELRKVVTEGVESTATYICNKKFRVFGMRILIADCVIGD